MAIPGWLRKGARVSLPEAFTEAVAEGRYGPALSSLLMSVEDVAANDRSAVQLASGVAIVAAEVGLQELATAAQEVTKAPRDIGSLRQLTDLLRQAELSQVRVAFAERLAHLTRGESSALFDLATAYEAVARYHDAFQLYESHTDQITDPFVRYLHAFNALMSGRLERSLHLLPKLGEIEDRDLSLVIDRLREMQRRAELASEVSPLDDGDLRGWHFAITGGILLTTSPHGPEEMGGRYGWLQDSVENCRQGIRRLHVVWEAWELTPPAIVYSPDRESQALATAMAQIWDRPLREFDPHQEGLVVVYTLDSVDPRIFGELAAFTSHRHLFNHATRWTGSDQYAADATTLMVQSVKHPWGEKMRVVNPMGPPPRPIEIIPPDDSPADVLADQILAATDESNEDDLSDSELSHFAMAVQPLAAAFLQDGTRYRMWEGGPVRSGRFL